MGIARHHNRTDPRKGKRPNYELSFPTSYTLYPGATPRLNQTIGLVCKNASDMENLLLCVACVKGQLGKVSGPDSVDIVRIQDNVLNQEKSLRVYSHAGGSVRLYLALS